MKKTTPKLRAPGVALGALAAFLVAAPCLFALNPSLPPSDNFDLTHWKLTLPVDGSGGVTGKAVDIPVSTLDDGFTATTANGYDANYFYTGSDGGMVFWCPVTGATTSGSSYPRCELREMTDSSNDNINWDPGVGTHTLDAQCVVAVQPSTGKTIIGQIHGFSGKAYPMIKLEFSSGTIRALVKLDPTSDVDTAYTFSNVGLNNLITYEIKVGGGTLTMTVNGSTQTADVSKWTGQSCYFKAGNYCQDNSGASSEGANVEFYALSASHAGTPTQVATPAFSPSGGTYSTAQTVAISDSTSGATIRYTIDGSTPTETNGIVYSGAVSISASATLKAIAYKSGLTDSAVAAANYVIGSSGGGASQFSISAGAVSDSSDDGNAAANTVDGSLATRWSAEGDGQWIKYDLGAPVTISSAKIAWYKGDTRVATFDLQVSSDGNGWTTVFSGENSGTTTGLETYDCTGAVGRYLRIVGHGNTANDWNSITETQIWGFAATGGTVATPTFSPAGGTYSSSQTITISESTSGAMIRYTVDGSAPTETHGTIYTAPLTVGSTCTLQAIAYEAGFTDSAVASAGYNINSSGGSPAQISIAGTAVTDSSDDGNVAANTVDGSLSTRWSANGDGQWIRYDLGASYTISYANIAWYSGDARVESFDIQVSSDGSSWTTVFSGQSSGTTTGFEPYDFADVTGRYVRIVGHENTVNTWNSIAETQIWGFAGSGGTAATPSFSPAGGSYSSAQTVTISDGTSGATIRYTLDGSIPTETNGTVYSSPVTIGSSCTLKAIAYKAGYADSAVASADYAINQSGTTYVEAEAMTLGSQLSIESNATYSGSAYVDAPSYKSLSAVPTGGQATYPFTAPTAATYYFWVRVKPDSIANDGKSFWWTVNGTWSTANEWTASGAGAPDTTLRWYLVSSISLTANQTSTFGVAYREGKLQWDTICITTDPNFTPSSP